MCVKTIFIFPHLVSDLDLYSFDLEIALQVTRHIGNLPSKFERRTEFCFWVNSWQETDRRMDGRTDGWTDTQTSVTWSPWEDLHTVTQINPKIKWIICCTKVYYINKFNKNFSHNLMSNSTRQIKQQTHQGKNIIFVVKVTSFQYQLLNYSVSFYCTSTQQCWCTILI